MHRQTNAAENPTPCDYRHVNDLPPRLRRPGLSFDTFKQSLKTYLFGDRSAYIEFICTIQKTLMYVCTISVGNDHQHTL